jgi:hypothetical protein
MALPQAFLNTFRDGQFASPMIGFLGRISHLHGGISCNA